MPKKDKIIMTREDHVKMRKDAGFKYEFTVTESKPYDHYEFLKTLSKLKIGGESKNGRKKS